MRACHLNLGTLTSWQVWLLADSSSKFRDLLAFQKSGDADGVNRFLTVSGVRLPGFESQFFCIPTRRLGTYYLIL